MVLTESVRSFHVPATPGTAACTPSRPSVPTSRASAMYSLNFSVADMSFVIMAQ